MKKWVVIIAVAALLTSCHSSRKNTSTVTTYPASSGNVVTQPSYDEAPAAKDDVRRKIIAEARHWIGTPYCYGGMGRDGTDCSGMVMTIYQQVGHIALPRNSARQHEACTPVSPDRLAPADLLFFSSKRSGGNISHVGIFIGGRDFIHASSSRGVMISNLDEPYYSTHFHSAGRVPALAVKSKSKKKKTKSEILPVPKPVEIPIRESSTPVVPDTVPDQDMTTEEAIIESIRASVRASMTN